MTTLTTTLRNALQGVLAVAKIAQTDFRCATGAPEAAAVAAVAAAAAEEAAVAAAAAVAALRPPAANPAATQQLDEVSGLLDKLPPDLDVGGVFELLHQMLSGDTVRDILPAIIPIVDEVEYLLETLAGWKGMSQSQVSAQLASTLGYGSDARRLAARCRARASHDRPRRPRASPRHRRARHHGERAS